MSCETQLGVRHLTLTFKNCDTGERIGPLRHKLADDDLPMWNLRDRKGEKLTGGWVKYTEDSECCEIKIIRDKRIPLSVYQGNGIWSVDLQVEYLCNTVYTGLDGAIVGEEKSDTRQVDMELTFESGIEETLPEGALIAA